MLVEAKNTINSRLRLDYQKPHFAFVDADNLRKSFFSKLKDLEIPEHIHWRFQFSRLLSIQNHDRVYVYSAIEQGVDLPDWLEEIRSQTDTVLKLGTVTKKGKRRKQEGVDVKLAIDATRLAYTRTMRTCTLYGADGDFIPLVEALSESGCVVEVASFSNPRIGRVAPILQAEADRYIHINGLWLNICQRDSMMPITSRSGEYPRYLQCPVHKRVQVHGEEIEIRKLDQEFFVVFDESDRVNISGCPDLDDLVTWIKLTRERV